MVCRAEKLDTCAQMTDLMSSRLFFYRNISLNFTKEVVCLLFLFCKFKRSVFQVPSCCSIWLSSWISAGTAEQLSTSVHTSARSAQRLRTEHEMLQQSSAAAAAVEFCSRVQQSSAAAAAGRHRPTLRLACVRHPALYPRLL